MAPALADAVPLVAPNGAAKSAAAILVRPGPQLVPDEAEVKPSGPKHDRRSLGLDDGLIDGVKILMVDDDLRNIFALCALLERGHADVTVVDGGAEALVALEQAVEFDIVLMDIMMPAMDGYETIRAVRAIDRFKDLPIVAVTGKATAGERQRCLDAGASDYVPKPVDSGELLAVLRPWLPETLNRSGVLVALTEPPAENGGVKPGRNGFGDLDDGAIDGVSILMVDDDLRNIFALSALLERGRADVTIAESGAEALAALDRTREIDIVLMDIMMPVMDGYETIRAIRAIDRFKDLPIIAVTGKATAGERQRCLDAGANDYVPKPVDHTELLAALRPWLPSATPTPA